MPHWFPIDILCTMKAIPWTIGDGERNINTFHGLGFSRYFQIKYSGWMWIHRIDQLKISVLLETAYLIFPPDWTGLFALCRRWLASDLSIPLCKYCVRLSPWLQRTAPTPLEWGRLGGFYHFALSFRTNRCLRKSRSTKSILYVSIPQKKLVIRCIIGGVSVAAN